VFQGKCRLKLSINGRSEKIIKQGGITMRRSYILSISIITILAIFILSCVDENDNGTGPEPVASLCVTPTSLTINDPTTTGIFEVWNCGDTGSTLSYSITESCNWLSVNISNGTSTGEHDNINVTVDFSSFESGETKTYIISVSGANDTKNVNVIANAEEAPEPFLCVTPSSFNINEPTTTGIFEVWNCGDTGSTLSYSITESCDWLSVNPTSGTSSGEHDDITVTVDFSSFDSEETKNYTLSISGENNTENVIITATAQKDINPIDPNPSDGSSDVETTLTLVWSTDDGQNLLFDVYFGTDPSPDEGELVSEQQSENSYTISTLLHNGTTFYWKIVVWEGNNSTIGDIWSFTTEQTTTVSYYPSKDTQAWEGNPDNNFGYGDHVQMGRMDWADWFREYGYFYFYLESIDIDGKFPIPIDANIEDGAFNLCLYNDNTNGSFGSNDYFQVKKVTLWWQEGTLTWNNKPTSEPSPGGSWFYGPFDDDQFYNFSDNNFTQIIRDWISIPDYNFGMVFEPVNFDDTDIAICSKDYGDQTKWPVLSITYTW